MEKTYTAEHITNELSKDRSWFELEQDILQAWNILEDLDIFVRKYADEPDPMSEDEVINYVFGIREVYSGRFEELWKTFEEQCKTRISAG